MNDFEKAMEQFGGEFDNTEASEFGFDVPAGDYIVYIKSANVNTAKSSGRWQVSWDYQIVGDKMSKFQNRHIFSHDGITKVDKRNGKHALNEVSVGIMKRGLKNIGISPVKTDNLKEAIAKAVGQVVAVSVKHTESGDTVFVNTNIIGPVAPSLDGFTPPSSPAQFEAMVNKAKEGAKAGQQSSGPLGMKDLMPSQQVSSGKAPDLSFEE